MKYQEDADQWKNADYEEYLDNTIRLKVETVNPFDLDIDEFAQRINFVDSDMKPVKKKGEDDEEEEVDEEAERQEEENQRKHLRMLYPKVERADRDSEQDEEDYINMVKQLRKDKFDLLRDFQRVSEGRIQRDDEEDSDDD